MRRTLLRIEKEDGEPLHIEVNGRCLAGRVERGAFYVVAADSVRLLIEQSVLRTESVYACRLFQQPSHLKWHGYGGNGEALPPVGRDLSDLAELCEACKYRANELPLLGKGERAIRLLFYASASSHLQRGAVRGGEE